MGAYGAVGIPVTTGAAIGNVDLGHLSNHMVWVLQIFAALVPVLVVAIQDGLRGIREVGLVALATGIVISGLQSIMLWVLQDPELIGIVPPPCRPGVPGGRDAFLAAQAHLSRAHRTDSGRALRAGRTDVQPARSCERLESLHLPFHHHPALVHRAASRLRS